MKLKDTFMTHKSGKSEILLDMSGDFSGLIRSNNQTAMDIIHCLQEECTIPEIVAKMMEIYDAPEDVLTRDVTKLVDQLRQIGAIEE